MGLAGLGEEFRADPRGQKVAWKSAYRGGLRLRVTARRLNDEPAPFRASLPCCYDVYYFQASGLTFGAPGCWKIRATVDRRVSLFVVRVYPYLEQP